MIEIHRALARQFRAVVRRLLTSQERRSSWPLVLCQAGEDGLAIQSSLGDVAVLYHEPQARSPEAIAFRVPVLSEFEGRTSDVVTLEQVAEGKVRTRWTDGAVPRLVDFDTVTPDSDPAFPTLPM